MYKITLAMSDPLTGDTEVLTYQFDPASLTQAKWSTAFPAVNAALQTLTTRAAPKEPPTW